MTAQSRITCGVIAAKIDLFSGVSHMEEKLCMNTIGTGHSARDIYVSYRTHISIISIPHMIIEGEGRVSRRRRSNSRSKGSLIIADLRWGPAKISRIVLSSTIVSSPRKDFCIIWIRIKKVLPRVWGKTEKPRYDTPIFPCFVICSYKEKLKFINDTF